MMGDYEKLTIDEMYALIALNNKGVIHFIYDKYAAAIYGLILKKVNDHNYADDILYKTFMLCMKTKPDPSQALPRIFIRLHNIALGLINKASILYPLRSEVNIQNFQRYC